VRRAESLYCSVLSRLFRCSLISLAWPYGCAMGRMPGGEEVSVNGSCWERNNTAFSLSLFHTHTHTHITHTGARAASNRKVWQQVLRNSRLLADALYKLYATRCNNLRKKVPQVFNPFSTEKGSHFIHFSGMGSHNASHTGEIATGFNSN
jgi:hypothetical protein